MRILLAGLLHLYPRPWRRRYGAELLTLAEDTQMKWSDPIDVAKGALTMRIDTLRQTPVSRIVLALTLSGALVGGIVAKSITAQYISTAILFVDSEPQMAGERLKEVFLHATARRRIVDVIQQYDLYPNLRKRVPLEDVVERVKRNVRIARAGKLPSLGGSAVEIAYEYEDGRTAQRVITSLIEKVVAANATLPVKGRPLAIKTIDGPDLPLTPAYPNVWSAVATGALGGLLLSMILGAWAVRTRQPRHHSV